MLIIQRELQRRLRRLLKYPRKRIQILASGLLIIQFLYSCSLHESPQYLLDVTIFPNRTDDFSLWQLGAYSNQVQMGYILKSDDNLITVIDGGGALTASALESYLKQLGGVVDTWIITHPHKDHVDAFLEIIHNNRIKVKRIVHSALDPYWVLKVEPEYFFEITNYNSVLLNSGIVVIDAKVGDELLLGENVNMFVLNSRNEEIETNAINNSSLVFKVWSNAKSVLFTGDLGPEGGDRLVRKFSEFDLVSDYVQMSHHGQAGANKEFYEKVKARYALWPTPEWLWSNRGEDGKVNSGNFRILEVRQWMIYLGIEENYVSGLLGTVQLD